MIWIYRGLVAPLLVFVSFILTPFLPKLRATLRLKMQPRPPKPNGQRPLWLHAASGEFEYAKAVIQELKKKWPELPLLVTYSSPSFVKNIESFPGVDLSLAMPLDLPGPITSFLRYYQPYALLLARTDLWPELLHQCRQKKIPIILFAYTQRDPALMSPLARWLRRTLLRQVDHNWCVSEADQSALTKMGILNSQAIGDPRYDQVERRLRSPKNVTPPGLQTDGPPILVAGSTWSADESILLEALAPLCRDLKLRLILVPHEPSNEHLVRLARRLDTHQLARQRFSVLKEKWNTPVLVVDQVGRLAELYPLGQMAFVGGSFRGSVHSVMEPLGAGSWTLVGPDHLNNREALEFSKIQCEEFSLVQPVTSAEEFKSKVEMFLQNPERMDRVQKTITREFQSRLGASRSLVEQLAALKIIDSREVPSP
ncbi:MAG: 3-deoxy-D-manno-octulosonic acid transferase [Bdellovibrionales bacterium]